MNDRMSHLTTICSFLAGGIAGATAALLLAPQSGRDTRQAIARTAGDTADSARGMKDRVLQKGEEIWGEATHRVDGAASALLGSDGHKPDGTPERATV